MATLYIIATPIGHLEDITYRAVRILEELDALACEDTRVTKRIYQKYNLRSPEIIFSYHEHNEPKACQRIISLLEAGKNVGICSDAGYPGISDPGYTAITQALAKGHPVEIIPGPSAVLTALVVSGLPMSSYLFKGFPPRKEGKRKHFLEMEKDLPHTIILFESKYRVKALLESALEVYGNRRCAVCVELTKKFETIYRGSLQEVKEQMQEADLRGEITVVIAGNNPKLVSV